MTPPADAIPWFWPVAGAILFLVGSVFAIVAAYDRAKERQARDVNHLIDEDWKGHDGKAGRRAELLEDFRKVVAEAFTGRAEADAHFRAEALAAYKTTVQQAISEHEARERVYVDGLRDRVTELVVEVRTSVAEAKRIAMHVSSEYRQIVARLDAVDRELAELKRSFAEFKHHDS